MIDAGLETYLEPIWKDKETASPFRTMGFGLDDQGLIVG